MPQALDEKLEALATAGVRRELCDYIRRHVTEAAPPRLFRISPYRLAGEWKVSEQEALDAFLLGTREGIFELEWSIRCHSCFGPADMRKELASLKGRAHCTGCNIDIQNAALDRHVEVNFKVGRGVRSLEEPTFGEIAKAWIKFATLKSILVGPGEQWSHGGDFEPGAYKLFTPDLKVRAGFLIDGLGEPSEPEISFVYDGSRLQWHSKPRVPGRYRLTFKNATEEPIKICFARSKETPWVSGLDVASNQNFRDMFSEELISADESFSVKNIVLLFTDIKGSTRLYERRGDARAYALVKRHFEILAETVQRYRGALVKTIGDAVMASFVEPADGLNAIFEAHRRFEDFNRAQGSSDDIVIKAGLHCGACIAVTSNERLDYFGRMVNIAARLQGQSRGGDVVVSKQFFEHGGVRGLVEKSGWNAAAETAELKGIERTSEIVRLS